ncbi:sugar transferase [Microbacterium sp. zg-Y818]|uniref:sugar transferase n=1 Tax=unclassified Microbacterium TaxID=2609290 RepID=UPI00214B2D07|nr:MULTISPECIES: sugar transferase [unclassified Microbacterium]MCR2801910.1 sugar transferase [Microbacterium sp. zg.Y818]WIM22833.1 sugar transferase [Microbacterium sp. zg-Y818]
MTNERLATPGTDRSPADRPAVDTSERDGAPRSTPPLRDDWRRRYARRLALTDLLVLIWVVYGTQIAWFGLGNAEVTMREDSRISEFSYWAFSAGLIALWMWALTLFDTRDHRIIGTGPTEYARVGRASFSLFGAIAIVAFLSRIDVARGFLLLSLPLGILVLVFVRWLWRQWLLAQRSGGKYSARVLLVGSERSVAQTARELLRAPRAGYVVVGVCVPSEPNPSVAREIGVPAVGTVDAVEAAIVASGADTVIVTSTDDLPPDKVKQISWGLEAGRQHLVLAPSITDIAGPRIHTRPVAGLPLIHVETPRFTRGQRLSKRLMDLIVATVGLIAISPVLFILAMCVKFSSPGPILFRQVRVGYRGETFTMLKFRTMVAHAEQILPELDRHSRDAGNDVLFKMRKDPRVTRVGRVMRRYSVDELPQLINVIGGSMSLVGPRPSLPAEVDQYADHVHRRFLAKPGITGLWQVSGRSSLSWEDSVRLDLAYVENWSLLTDFSILARTAKAALAPGETAY